MEMNAGIFDGMFTVEEESPNKILASLLDAENISTKTELLRPLALTKLEIYAKWLEIEGLKDSAALVNLFVLSFKINMVSHKRKSREEVIRALTQMFKDERTVTDKLASKENPNER